jgi:hypothetical protein
MRQLHIVLRTTPSLSALSSCKEGITINKDGKTTKSVLKGIETRACFGKC